MFVARSSSDVIFTITFTSFTTESRSLLFPLNLAVANILRIQADVMSKEKNDFEESVGPQGPSYIVNTQVHLARRVFWTMVFIFAVTQSILIIIANGQRFYEYPSTMKSTDPVNAQFPKVTICLNSMHSKSGLAHNYPGLDKALPFYYGQVY